MTAEYWNKHIAKQSYYARPVNPDARTVWLVPTCDSDGIPLPPDFIENAGEIGFSMPLTPEDTDVRRFPFRHDDVIQHVSKTGDRFVVRLVDDAVFECYAENLDRGHGTRVINPENWTKIGIQYRGDVIP